MCVAPPVPVAVVATGKSKRSWNQIENSISLSREWMNEWEGKQRSQQQQSHKKITCTYNGK